MVFGGSHDIFPDLFEYGGLEYILGLKKVRDVLSSKEPHKFFTPRSLVFR